MYRAYFMEELDIGDVTVLASVAARLGLDAEAFTAALENGTYSKAEKEAVDYSRNVLKPTGVPTIYIDGVKAELSEYTTEEMIHLLQGASGSTGGFCCGANGCG